MGICDSNLALGISSFGFISDNRFEDKVVSMSLLDTLEDSLQLSLQGKCPPYELLGGATYSDVLEYSEIPNISFLSSSKEIGTE